MKIEEFQKRINDCVVDEKRCQMLGIDRKAHIELLNSAVQKAAADLLLLAKENSSRTGRLVEICDDHPSVEQLLALLREGGHGFRTGVNLLSQFWVMRGFKVSLGAINTRIISVLENKTLHTCTVLLQS